MFSKQILNKFKQLRINCNSIHTINYQNLCVCENKVPLIKLAVPHRLNIYRLRFVHSVAVSLGRRQFNTYSGFFSKENIHRYYSSLQDTIKMPEVKPFQRLPENVKPKHYQLSLVPDLKSLTFQGDVSIQIEVLKPTNEIVLNALDLQLNTVILRGSFGKISPTKIELCADEETAHFKFNDALPVGLADLDIAFKGEINDKMKGLYRSKYVNEKGEDAYAAVTQFESTDARRCFPCWDEPALKATFDIKLTVPQNLVALSNMPVKSSETKEDLITYNFEKTPIMSTYLVAAVIGEYDYVEDKSSDGILVRVYTPKG